MWPLRRIFVVIAAGALCLLLVRPAAARLIIKHGEAPADGAGAPAAAAPDGSHKAGRKQQVRASGAASRPRVIIIPGMVTGCAPFISNFWYSAVIERLRARGYEAEAPAMPDCVLAREAVWEPFLKDTLRAGPRDVLVGHSSGAAAALRYAEKNKVAGVIVLSAMATDMGLPWEKAAGWFARPWDWAAVKRNAGFVVQFAARNDVLIPFAEQKAVADAAGAELHIVDKGHYLDKDFRGLETVLLRKLRVAEKRLAGGGSSGADASADGGSDGASD